MTSPEDKHDSGDAAVRDRQALATLWEQSRQAVFAYLTSLVYDFHRAEDLLQEVAVAIAGQFQSYDAERPFLAWAMGIARNRTLLYFREQARDRRHFTDATFRLLDAAAQRLDRHEGPSKREALRHCLSEVRGRRRRVVELRYNGNLKIADIAEQLSVTPNSVKVMLHRVRNALEDCIRRRLARESMAP
jgi:RNA polymerase sigma-70 factor, ECF subfamily